MKRYRTILIVLCGLCMISCAKQESGGAGDNSAEFFSLLSSDNDDYQPHKVNEALKGDYKNYEKFFEGTDYEIGISSSKDGALPGGSRISCISGKSQIRKAIATKSSIDGLPPIKSFVDGVEISQENIRATTKSSTGIMDCFGKVVKFTFGNDNGTRASGEGMGEADMYVPAAIEFLFPRAETEEDLNPLCYYKNFVIRWNKDENNANGVLVVIDWTGSMVLGNDIADTQVCRIATFPDTGEALLSEEMFDGIPDTALCDMMILRGNVENVEQGGYSYKLLGKTHQQISFILIRELEYQQ